ncbi:MAG TPA: hypothetical protein VF200_00710 [Woeseiaceae bacterium]
MKLAAVLPLFLAAALYTWMAYNYVASLGRPGLMLAFAGYAVANVGFIWDAWG